MQFINFLFYQNNSFECDKKRTMINNRKWQPFIHVTRSVLPYITSHHYYYQLSKPLNIISTLKVYIKKNNELVFGLVSDFLFLFFIPIQLFVQQINKQAFQFNQTKIEPNQSIA